MGTGFIVSMIVTGIAIIAILGIMIPYDRKHIVRKNRKIDFKETVIYLRWNVFDTMTLVIAVYTIICVQALNMLLSFGNTIDDPFVQFFTNQSQAWVIVTIAYLVTRLSMTMKSIKAQFGDAHGNN